MLSQRVASWKEAPLSRVPTCPICVVHLSHRMPRCSASRISFHISTYLHSMLVFSFSRSRERKNLQSPNGPNESEGGVGIQRKSQQCYHSSRRGGSNDWRDAATAQWYSSCRTMTIVFCGAFHDAPRQLPPDASALLIHETWCGFLVSRGTGEKKCSRAGIRFTILIYRAEAARVFLAFNVFRI